MTEFKMLDFFFLFLFGHLGRGLEVAFIEYPVSANKCDGFLYALFCFISAIP